MRNIFAMGGDGCLEGYPGVEIIRSLSEKP
jgi:hypothetical protein